METWKHVIIGIIGSLSSLPSSPSLPATNITAIKYLPPLFGNMLPKAETKVKHLLVREAMTSTQWHGITAMAEAMLKKQEQKPITNCAYDMNSNVFDRSKLW